jgi:hypothetical protein
MAKVHSKKMADELLRLGWTLVTEFQDPGDDEPYEYYFEWKGNGEPIYIDWNRFETTNGSESS